MAVDWESILTLGGAFLELSNWAKYLGIILDSKLKCNENTEVRIKKARVALYIYQEIIG